MSEKDIELQAAYCCEMAQRVTAAEQAAERAKTGLAREQEKLGDMLRAFRKHLTESETC